MADEYKNGDSFWKDMPWWVKAIAVVGVPSILSIGVVWSDRVQLLSKMETEATILSAIQSNATVHFKTDQAFDENLEQYAIETNRILLATCINSTLILTTGANEARDRCYGIRR